MNTDPKVVLFTDYVSMCVGVLCVINSKNVNKKKLRVKSNRVYGNDVWRYKMLFGKMEEKTNRWNMIHLRWITVMCHQK